MITAPVSEIKRRGVAAFDAALSDGPVCLVRNNRPAYVLLSFSDYRRMEDDATFNRIRSSESDIAAGRVKKGSSDALMAELGED